MPLICVRLSPLPIEYVINDETDVVKNDKRLKIALRCIDDNIILNYSMNLLGGGFDVTRDIYLRTKDEGKELWDGKRIIPKSKDKGLWTLCETAYPIFYNLRDLHELPLPYKETMLSEQQLKEREDLLDKQNSERARNVWKSKKQPYDYNGTIRIDHEPTNLNYWHVVLNAYGEGEVTPTMPGSSRKHKTMKLHIIQYLRCNYLPITNFVIPANCYIA